MDPLIQFISIAFTVVLVVLIGFAIYFAVMLLCGTLGCIDWGNYEQINHAPVKNQPASGQISPEDVTIPTDRDRAYPPREEKP